ncbi:protein SDA1 homolog [Petromyzon marinus]
MAGRRNNQLAHSVQQLQNLVKRDPESYRDEFLQQYRHYESKLEVFQLHPEQPNKELGELIMFIAQVAHCYKDLLAEFPQHLAQLLQQHHSTTDTELRMCLCRALILMRHKDLVQPLGLLELFFTLLRCPDKLLRKTLYQHIVSDIRGINAKHRNNRVNTALQNFLYSMVRDSNSTAAKMALDVMVQMYKRNVW